MQKLNLTKRPAKIGKSVNTRTEMHGKDEVPGQDIPVSGIFLSAEELCLITDEATAVIGLFRMEGDQYVPRFLAVSSIPIDHRFDNATIKMSGGCPATTYKNGKIKSIKLAPLGGGLTELSCTLQVNPENGSPSAQMLINAKISISIKAELEEEAAADPELPLEHQGQGEEEEAVPLDGLTPTNPDVEETRLSRTGRKIQAHAYRQGRKRRGKPD
jgi:hypothetical protein